MEAAMEDPSTSNPTQLKEFSVGCKIMLTAIILLLFAIILIIALHLYVRWYLLRARRRRSLLRRNRLLFYFEPHTPSTGANIVGLDSSVLNSIPVFTFTSNSHSDPIDCAVCLSEFEELEIGRSLPKCGHSFHIDCIDMWFHSHSTCPLCRSPVERVLPTPVKEPVMHDPSSSSDRRSFAAGSRSFRARRKPIELGGVLIEIPSRTDCEFATAVSPPSTPFTPSFKSPISRVMSLSFKRIIGREKSDGLSPSGNSGACSSGAGGELDIERGKETIL